ncbi:hypothetical protein JQ604_32045 [Bradyrhizobium jicamae]|uniref:hypothetical protein n=1 Tax=Bradyrhizobium jicamae TaxID=280332 RepID=UPI001BAABC83|nr:hypothetical protein [Bradyrhizobium jicamae]MBR0756836.1 hypothetical protein [Bradyrhizobium jicamae]
MARLAAAPLSPLAAQSSRHAHCPPENRTTLPDGRPVKITLGEMRATGVRGPIALCVD